MKYLFIFILGNFTGVFIMCCLNICKKEIDK